MSKRPLLQPDLFGGPTVPFVPEIIRTAPAPRRDEVEPVIVLEGQLDLLEARTTRLARVTAALADGRFDEAAELVAPMPKEQQLGKELRLLALTIGSTSGVDELAQLDLTALVTRLDSIAPAAVASGVRRGFAVHVARMLDAAGPGSRAAGAGLAAQFWLRARRIDDARRSLEACVAAGIALEEALILLGNLASDQALPAKAREHYRTAFWRAPADVRVDEVADDEVVAACEEARELAPAPHLAWMPIVGFAGGLWGIGACESPDAASDPARFHAALLRSRIASRQGRPDVAARRELKALAPTLFARLLEDGLL